MQGRLDHIAVLDGRDEGDIKVGTGLLQRLDSALEVLVLGDKFGNLSSQNRDP